jgi:hypothetical protein
MKRNDNACFILLLSVMFDCVTERCGYALPEISFEMLIPIVYDACKIIPFAENQFQGKFLWKIPVLDNSESVGDNFSRSRASVEFFCGALVQTCPRQRGYALVFTVT